MPPRTMHPDRLDGPNPSDSKEKTPDHRIVSHRVTTLRFSPSLPDPSWPLPVSLRDYADAAPCDQVLSSTANAKKVARWTSSVNLYDLCIARRTTIRGFDYSSNNLCATLPLDHPSATQALCTSGYAAVASQAQRPLIVLAHPMRSPLKRSLHGTHRRYKTNPPSTLSTVPVTKAASSEARKR